MKLNAPVRFVVFAGFALLLAACPLTGAPITPAEQSPSPLQQAESPLATGSNFLDSASAYQTTLRREERYTQADGSLLGGIIESNYYWTRSKNPYGFNDHHVTTIRDWEMETPGVMDESYQVDDFAFSYCASCPPVDDSAGGWSVSKRNEGIPAGANVVPPPDPLSTVIGMPLAEFLAKSVEIGDESINGLPATHYQITDAQSLNNVIIMQLGANPDESLEVTLAQMDVWLTGDDQQLIQYTFQIEGNRAVAAGSQDLRPFTFLVQYFITEFNSPMTITVPSEVLDAVEPQLRELEK